MKRAIFTTIMLLAAMAAQAQHFDWAKGYSTTQDEGNFIKGTVTDGEGSLYILGAFRNDACWDGERLLPIAPYGPHSNTTNTIIAKISPDGEMLWKKVLHSNNGQCNFPQDIKKVGDTAFACMVQATLPSTINYTYYLDTLIDGYSDYPIPCMYMECAICNAFIVFDFEGNVKEQHFIQLTYTDYNGEDIVYYANQQIDPTPWHNSTWCKEASFDIDADGNIYISRWNDDWCHISNGDQYFDVQNGTIRGVKVWVDRRFAGQYAIDGRPMKWYPHMMKFAPHFDTLLASRYVVQGQSDSVNYNILRNCTKVDAYGNVYYLCEIIENGEHNENTIVIDSAKNISFYHDEKSVDRSFLVQYDNNLNANWLVTLDDSVIYSEYTSNLLFHDLAFDYDSNLFFLSASTGRGRLQDTINFYSILTYNGLPLDLKNSAFVMTFRMDTISPVLHSYGTVPAPMYSDCNSFWSSASSGNLICRNNRIFLQHRFTGVVRYPNQNVRLASLYDKSMGLVMFDYSGRVIEGKTYNTSSPNSRVGSISLHDSILYLTNLLYEDNATFGDIQVPAQGKLACVAKYVDTSFMSTYVHTGDTGDVSVTLVDGGEGAFVAYPNPFRQCVRIRVENGSLLERGGAAMALLTDMEGRSEELRLKPDGEGCYLLDLTSRPQATYLLTLTTADGQRHTLRLLKQSDMFGE